MNKASDPGPAGDLMNVLQQEKTAILAGDFASLENIVTQKEDLIERINALEDPDPNEIEKLQRHLVRNQELLDAAMRGLAAVADRLSALKEVRQGLQTYDNQGRRQSLDVNRAGSLEKRA